MAKYGQAFKDKAVARLLPPESASVETVSAIKEAVASDREAHVMDEIYWIAFNRHHDFLTVQYRARTSIPRRIISKLRSMAGAAEVTIAAEGRSACAPVHKVD